jgi:hypothetical protein
MLKYAKTIVLKYISSFVKFLPNTQCNSKDNQKDVGLQIVSKMHFYEDIDYIFSKCVKMLGLILFILFYFSNYYIINVLW